MLRLVLARTAVAVALGCGTGLAVAAGGSRALARFLYGISNLDPAAFVGALIGLLLITAIVALLPASRALRLDPARAIRTAE